MAAEQSAHASLLSVDHDPCASECRRSVAPYDADRLLYVTRVPVRAVRGAVAQLDSRLVRQQCIMSGRTATWRKSVHSTIVIAVNDWERERSLETGYGLIAHRPNLVRYIFFTSSPRPGPRCRCMGARRSASGHGVNPQLRWHL
eukprot:1931028-Prymnesium_polylepis.1